MADDGRAAVLRRLRQATARLGQQPTGAPAPSLPESSSDADVAGLFAERVADYGAHVIGGTLEDALAGVTQLLATARQRVLIPQGLDPRWADHLLGAGVEIVRDEGFAHDALDGIGAVLTGSRAAIATTGSVVLDHGPDQGRRAVTLVPDWHLCIVGADAVVPDVADVFPRLDPTKPLTWISGPSATSDIELIRVAGVHGPRRLTVVLLDASAPD